MPVPAEKDSNQTSTTTSNDVTSAPAANPASPTSATHINGDSVSSPVAEENGVAERSNEEEITSPPPSLQQSNGHTENSTEKPLKIFVGGLSWQTSEEDVVQHPLLHSYPLPTVRYKLKEIFEDYGEVTECSIMRDPISKKSRGFGFVTFSSYESVDKVLNAHFTQPICIDDKTIDPKIAIPPKRLSSKVKRIFVGGLSADSIEEDLREYFEQFGKVVESQLMYDRNTNRHRGFGFVTFDSEEPAEKVCSIQYHDIKGKKVEVKVAQTKEALAMQQARSNRMLGSRNYSGGNYGYPSHPYGPTFYPTSPHYPLDLMSMGGYSAAPVLIGSSSLGGKPHRGLKGRNYSHYAAFTYPQGGWGDHQRMGGYYGPAYGGVPMHLMRGHPVMDPVTTSGMDYITDQFQGIAISTAGYPPSPAGQYPPMTPISLGGVDPMTLGNHMSSGSYSPPHSLSPKGIVTTATVNGFTQVPTYTGSQSYAVAQPSY